MRGTVSPSDSHVSLTRFTLHGTQRIATGNWRTGRGSFDSRNDPIYVNIRAACRSGTSGWRDACCATLLTARHRALSLEKTLDDSDGGMSPRHWSAGSDTDDDGSGISDDDEGASDPDGGSDAVADDGAGLFFLFGGGYVPVRNGAPRLS